MAAAPVMRAARHGLEAWLIRGLAAAIRARDPRRAGALGERFGNLARSLGARRTVAEANLRLAFPERSEVERAAILRAHFRELGRVVAEYARLAELARAGPDPWVVEMRGIEHLEAARAAGRGAILLSGHYSSFELAVAAIARDHPVDLVVRTLTNPRAEAWIATERRRAGVGLIDAASGLRAIYRALRANRVVGMLADQDARRAGVFVPFLGRPASTPIGPARVALATGAALLMGAAIRRADGRLDAEIEPPLAVPDPGAPDAAERLTALHVARLEVRVRARPELWFWLHRRWKTPPPVAVLEEA